MDPFDELLIKKYLAMDKEISRLIKYKDGLKEVFYSQNMATRLVYDVHGIHSEGFRQDRKVLDYLESLAMVDGRISNHELRKKYFNDFLHSLSIRELNDLISSSLKSISSLLIEKVIGEIKEIEIAINYRYGIEVDILDEVDAEEMNENVGRMCDFFAI